MVYPLFRNLLLGLLRAPKDPPKPPTGDKGNIKVFRAAPAFLAYRLVTFLVGTIPTLLFSMVLFGAELIDLTRKFNVASLFIWSTVIAIFLGSIFFRYLLIRIDYDLRYYVITDRSIRIREGAWLVHESTFTFANIQNLTISQGPIERLLGISTLLVETAGGGSGQGNQNNMRQAHVGAIRGIKDAQEMRDQIMGLLRRYRDAGLGNEATHLSGSRPKPKGAGLSAAAIARLREVRDEVRALEAAGGFR